MADLSAFSSLFDQRTNRIYYTVELDTNVLFVIYDKYGATDANVYVREIDYTDPTSPSVSAEQTVWTGNWETFSGNSANSLRYFKNPIVKLTSTMIAVNFIAGTSTYTQKYLKLTKSGSTWTGTLVAITGTNTYTSSTFWSVSPSFQACRINDDSFIWLFAYSTTNVLYETNVTTNTTTSRRNINLLLGTTSLDNYRFLDLGSGKILFTCTVSTNSTYILTISGTTYTWGSRNSLTGNPVIVGSFLYNRSDGVYIMGQDGKRIKLSISGDTVSIASTETAIGQGSYYVKDVRDYSGTTDIMTRYSSNVGPNVFQLYNPYPITTPTTQPLGYFNYMMSNETYHGNIRYLGGRYHIITEGTVSPYTIGSKSVNTTADSYIVEYATTIAPINRKHFLKISDTAELVVWWNSAYTEIYCAEIDLTNPQSPTIGSTYTIASGLPASGGGFFRDPFHNGLTCTSTDNYVLAWQVQDAPGTNYQVRMLKFSKSNGIYSGNYNTYISGYNYAAASANNSWAYVGNNNWLLAWNHLNTSYEPSVRLYEDTGTAFTASSTRLSPGYAVSGIAEQTKVKLTELENGYALYSFNSTTGGTNNYRHFIISCTSGNTITFGSVIDTINSSTAPITWNQYTHTIRKFGTDIYVFYLDTTLKYQKYTYSGTTLSTNGSSVSLSTFVITGLTSIDNFYIDGSTMYIQSNSNAGTIIKISTSNTDMSTVFSSSRSIYDFHSTDQIVKYGSQIVVNRTNLTTNSWIDSIGYPSSTPTFNYSSDSTISISASTVTGYEKSYSSNPSLAISTSTITKKAEMNYVSDTSLTLYNSTITERIISPVIVDTNPSTFRPDSIQWLSDTKFVMAYKSRSGTTDTAYVRIGDVVSGITTLGTAYVLGSASDIVGIACESLDSTHGVAIFTNNQTNNSYVEAFSVSGNVITLGGPSLYRDSSVNGSHIDTIDSTHFVICSTTNNSSLQTRVGTVTGINISLGIAQTLSGVSTTGDYTEVEVLGNGTQFIAGYEDATTLHFMAVVGDMTGNTVVYQTPVEISTTAVSEITLERLDATHMVASYVSNSSGYSKILTLSGSILSAGTAYQFNSGGMTPSSGICTNKVNDHLCLVVYSAGEVYYQHMHFDGNYQTISYDELTQVSPGGSSSVGADIEYNHYLVVAYRDDTNSGRGMLYYAKIPYQYEEMGELVLSTSTSTYKYSMNYISDMSMTVSEIGIYTKSYSYSSNPSLALSESGIYVRSRSYSSSATVHVEASVYTYRKSNITVSLGAETEVHSWTPSTSLNTVNISVDKIDSSHFIVGCLIDTSINYVEEHIGTISNNVITYGSGYQVETYVNTSEYCAVAMLDSTNSIIAYKESNPTGNYVLRTGTLSGGTISYGTRKAFGPAPYEYAIYDISIVALSSTKFIMSYCYGSDKNVSLVVGSVSSGVITLGTTEILESGEGSGINLSYLDSSHVAYVYTGNNVIRSGVATISDLTVTHSDIWSDSISPSSVSICTLNSNICVISYIISNIGYLRVIDRSDNTYGSAYAINSAPITCTYINLLTFNYENMFIFYGNDYNTNGILKHALIYGKTISYGSTSVFASRASNIIDSTLLSSTNAVVAYTPYPSLNEGFSKYLTFTQGAETYVYNTDAGININIEAETNDYRQYTSDAQISISTSTLTRGAKSYTCNSSLTISTSTIVNKGFYYISNPSLSISTATVTKKAEMNYSNDASLSISTATVTKKAEMNYSNDASLSISTATNYNKAEMNYSNDASLSISTATATKKAEMSYSRDAHLTLSSDVKVVIIGGEVITDASISISAFGEVTRDYSKSSDPSLTLSASTKADKELSWTSNPSLTLSSDLQRSWINNWIVDSNAQLLLSTESIVNFGKTYNFNIDITPLVIAEEAITNFVTHWNKIVSANLTISADIQRSWTNEWDKHFDNMLAISESAGINWTAIYSAVVSGELTPTALSIYDFLRRFSYSSNGYLNIYVSSNIFWHDAIYWNYNSEAMMSVISESIYDLLRSFSYSSGAMLDIDASAVSMFSRIYDNKSNGSLILDEDVAVAHRSYRPVWNYNQANGTLTITMTSITNHTAADLQYVYCTTPITGSGDFSTPITGSIELSTPITYGDEYLIKFRKEIRR